MATAIIAIVLIFGVVTYSGQEVPKDSEDTVLCIGFCLSERSEGVNEACETNPCEEQQ